MVVRTIKRFVRGLLFCVALLLIGLLLLPTVLGTKWIYQPLVERLAADDFILNVDSVRLRWFSPLKFERIEVKQADGTGLISVAEIRTDRSLFGYLIGGRQIGRIEIIRPTVDVKLLEDSSNLNRFIKAIEGKAPVATATPKRPASKLRIDVNVVIRGASAKLQREGESEPLVVIPPFEVDVQYLAADGPSRLRIAATQVLKDVQLTPELIDLGLGYAVPLLAQSAWFDGRVSLQIAAIEIPLDIPVQSEGAAVLTLHSVRSGPAQPAIVNLLDFIATLRGRTAQHEFVFVDGSQIALAMKDAQVSHTGLQVGLPKLDTRLQLESSGAVGLIDRHLALTLRIPVPVEQLARRDEVKDLGVPKLNVPIGGTLDQPVIEWGGLRSDSAALIASIRGKVSEDAPGTAAVLSVLEGLARGEMDQPISAATDLIKAIREQRKSADEAMKAENPEPRRPIRDAFRDLFRGTGDSP